MKRVRLVIVLVLALAVAITALLLNRSQEMHEKHWTVALATLMSQPALDQVREGIKERLTELGYNEGKNLRLIERNANGQVQLAASIATELAAQSPDAFVAITTPMAQSAAKVVRCPLIFAAVTDPVGAGLVSDLAKPEPNVTGTCDAWPYKAQLELICSILPRAKVLGILYNPGESASQFGIKRIRELAPSFGFSLQEAPANTTAEVFPAAAGLANRVDALFLSSDNTVIGGVAGAVKVAVTNKIPLFVGDSGTVEKGGIGAVSVGYHQLGRDTGELVSRVLHGERMIPVVVETGTEIFLNREAARRMGVVLPKDVVARATKVYDELKQ